MTGDYLLVLTTCPDAENARAIARALVGERLAACENRIDGVVSTYRWQGDAHVRRADFNPPSSWPVETGPTGADRRADFNPPPSWPVETGPAGADRRADFNPPSSRPVETGPTGALRGARGSAGCLRWIAEATA
jgi:hypothetical protein